MGSSPRVRGKPALSEGGGSFSVAHPRACGENGGRHHAGAHGPGSSPRVRGKHEVLAGVRGDGRLIPARAGKTDFAAARPSATPAHPRACGENSLVRATSARSPGSSPRVRGKPGPRHPPAPSAGLIPARAGKTPPASPPIRSARAHPRACGENALEMVMLAVDAGSSPRVRGKRFLTWAFTARVGRILETLEPSAFSESYSFPGARANGGQCRARRRGLCTGPALGRPLGAS